MKQLFSALFTSLLFTAASAQVTIDTEVVLGGSENEILYDMIATSDGGFLLCGYTRSTDFDITENNGLYDYWIVKTDTDGGIIWQTSVGGSADDLARSCVEIDGNFYIAGISSSSDGDISANYGLQDGLLVKLDGDGNLIWEKNYGGSGNDQLLDVIGTSDGGLLMLGYSASADIDLPGNYGSNDYWVVKTDIDGNLEWSDHYGGSLNDFGTAVVEIPGGYIMTGATYSNDNDVSGNHNDLGTSSDVWLVRIEDGGDIFFQACFGGVNNEVGEDLVVTLTNTVGVIASTKSIDGDLTEHYGELNKFDIWLFEANNSGELLQQKIFGGTKDDLPNAIALDTDGGFLVSSNSSSNDTDVGGHYGLTSNADIWVFKTDAALNLAWEQNLGGSQTEYCEAIIPNGDDTYSIGAYTKSSDFDVSFHYGISGNNDYWFARLIPGAPDTTGDCSVAITEQPVDVLTCPGSDVTFTVGGSDSVTSYQWVFVTSGSTFTTTEPFLNFGGTGGSFATDYYVIAIGACGNDTSDIATFTVGALPEPPIFPVLPPSICDVPVITIYTDDVPGYLYQWYLDGVAIPGATDFEYDATAAGTYYVAIDNGADCTATSESIEITSEGPDALVTLDGPANICNTGSVTLSTVTGAGYTYQWYLDGSAIAGATSSSYSTSTLGAYYVVVDADGCLSTSVTINVINEAPTAVTSPLGELDICETGSVSLTCTTTGVGYSYQWLKDEVAIPGAITITIFALDTGAYTCVVSNAFGCSDTAEALIVYTSCPDTTVNPAVKDLSDLLGMQVFPNPAETAAQVQVQVSAALSGNYMIQVLEPTGRILENRTTELTPGTHQILLETTGWPAGIYLIRLSHDGYSGTIPLIKQ